MRTYACVCWMVLGAAANAAGKPLFNGRDLDGWMHEGPMATFSAVKGELVTSGAGNYPNWLHTSREYENFRLRFEYKLAQWAEAAVILRAPRVGRPLQSGLGITLAHDFHKVVDSHVTGAIAGVLPPRTALPESYDAWHRVEVELAGERLKVVIDGKVMQDADLAGQEELRYRLKRGYIGFPDLGYGYAVRGLEIEELPEKVAFTELFDGRTLDGWQLRGGGNWRVRDGALEGANGDGILYAPGVFADFELTALVRSHNRVNSGVFLRGSADLSKPRGFEIQVYSPPDAVYQTGSIYGVERSRLSADLEDQWFLLQVRVEGSSCVVRVNGETVARAERLPGEKAGQVGLQIHKANSSVEFRDLRVRVIK